MDGSLSYIWETILLCELSGLDEADHKVAFYSTRLNMTVHVTVSTITFRQVHHAGGIDQWLRNTPKNRMTAKARRLRYA